jgi:hypothetical protein
VSNLGRVKSLDRYIKFPTGDHFTPGRMLVNGFHINGYQYVGLHKNGKRETFRIHRLVALSFIPNPENKPEVNHKDENINNNKADNLEWLTSKENANFGTRTEKVIKIQRIKTVKLDDGLNLIKIYDSFAQAAIDNNVTDSCIVRVCKGRYLHSNGFRWMYYDDYLLLNNSQQLALAL